MLDRAVLPPGVHRLEHDEDRVPVVGVEKGLLTSKLLDIALGVLLGAGLGPLLARGGRIDFAQFERLPRFDAERLAVVQDFEPPADGSPNSPSFIVMER